MDEHELARFMKRPSWMADANCRGLDPRRFFPERNEDLSFARQVCRACDVQAECLAYALNNGERNGIWGGMNERDRRRIRRRRAAIATGPVRRSAPVEEHGSEAGYAQHTRAGTPPCLACLSAHAVANEFRKRDNA